MCSMKVALDIVNKDLDPIGDIIVLIVKVKYSSSSPG